MLLYIFIPFQWYISMLVPIDRPINFIILIILLPQWVVMYVESLSTCSSSTSPLSLLLIEAWLWSIICEVKIIALILVSGLRLIRELLTITIVIVFTLYSVVGDELIHYIAIILMVMLDLI